ncbi:MAG: hypothetical protein H0T53_15005 [Herpetosiphonaceae bacterium]|nr:hypothetical protein [Herpetosiphonaceae bacterium]
MDQPGKFEKQARTRVGGGAVEGGRWHGRLVALVALLGGLMLLTLIVSASLDPAPAPAIPPTSTPAIPPTDLPAEQAATVAWVLQNDRIVRWDASGTSQLERVCRRCAPITRPSQPPLFIDHQDNGTMALYDPLDGSTTLLEMADSGLIQPPLLAPDGQQIALRTFGDRGEDKIVLADLTTGATWTVLDASALSGEDIWLLEHSQLQRWDGQYLYALSVDWGRQVLWRIQLKPNHSEGPQLAPEILLDLPLTGALVLDPVFGRTAYLTPTAGGGPELRLRSLAAGNPEQVIASDVYELSRLSPDGTQLVYRRIRRSSSSSQLVLYNLATSEQRVLVEGTSLNPYAFQWSQHGEHLLMLYPDMAVIFGMGEKSIVRVPLEPLTVGVDMTSSATFVALSFTNERYYLTIHPWNLPDAKQVIPLGTDPATLVYVP